MILLEHHSMKLRKEEQAIFDHYKEIGEEASIVRRSLKQLIRKRYDGNIMDYDLVAGSLPFVEAAFKQMGYEEDFDCYPVVLKDFLHREISVTTKRFLNPNRFPIFIKPKLETKAFTGFVAEDITDYRLNFVKSSIPIYISEVVEWVSEWRIYLQNPFCFDPVHYSGDPHVLPHYKAISKMIEVIHKNNLYPVVLDVGVLSSGDTALVEVNQAYSVGLYSDNKAFYTELLKAQWAKIKESLK
ncbi:hypothetical protein [Klebsiella phage YC1]|nr:hypothetical protein [Klebsiella phage YC1]